jgi:hypothetical protein
VESLRSVILMERGYTLSVPPLENYYFIFALGEVSSIQTLVMS